MILDACEAVQNACGTNATLICRFIMKLLGPALVAGYYWLLGYHTWVFLTIIAPVLRKRVGAEFATLWTIIGIIITFNQVWNHVLAMCLKPGSPKDLIVSVKQSLISATFMYLLANRKATKAAQE